MLSKEDNELLTHVGPGTPMGDLMRQYWMPIYLSTDLEKPDNKPHRIKLLHEKLTGIPSPMGKNRPSGIPFNFGRGPPVVPEKDALRRAGRTVEKTNPETCGSGCSLPPPKPRCGVGLSGADLFGKSWY